MNRLISGGIAALVGLVSSTAFASVATNDQYEPTGATGTNAGANWSAPVWTDIGTGATGLTGPNDPAFQTYRMRVQNGESVVVNGNYSVQRVYFNGGTGANAITVAAGDTLNLATYNDQNSAAKFGAVGGAGSSNLLDIAGTVNATGELVWQADGTVRLESGAKATFGGITYNSASYTPTLALASGSSLNLVANTSFGSTETAGVSGTQSALATDFSGTTGGFGAINAVSYVEFGTLNLTAAANTPTGVYTLINTTAGLSGAYGGVTLNGSSLLLGTATVSNGEAFTLAQTGNALTLAVVNTTATPEPASLGLLGLATVSLAGRRRTLV